MGSDSSAFALKPKFKAEKSKDGTDPLKITFTDVSDTTAAGSVPMFFKWDFGDGSANDNTKNPVHVYPKVGSYLVKFWTAVKPNVWVDVPATAYVDVVMPAAPTLESETSWLDHCYAGCKPITDSKKKGQCELSCYGRQPVYIPASTPASEAPTTPVPAKPMTTGPNPAAPASPAPAPKAPPMPQAVPQQQAPNLAQPGQLVPKFNVYQTQGGDAATFVFKDASDGTVQYWSWDFGDQVGNSTDSNPTYKFTSSGTYTVHMYVSNDEFRKKNGPDAWISASTKLPVTVQPVKEGFGSVVNMDWIIWLIIVLLLIAVIYGRCN